MKMINRSSCENAEETIEMIMAMLDTDRVKRLTFLIVKMLLNLQ